ncbi:MAG: DNA topoisomerase 4 subunit A [Eubacterium sp.]|nr:DNA topoisomerase 4 subunit A [Eubacterium sp.]
MPKKAVEDNIIQLDFAEEMKTSYRDYAVSVIVARALPDVRDGLKPVQRRILYAMHQLGLAPDGPYRKSARIVGDTMGKYHPHGDSSIYDALVHMTEDYSLNAPLVDGHGNFGSIDGDSAAAMRYTEAKLSPAAMSMLENLEKGLVDFVPNFDDTESEPVVLPAELPNLLINGTTGIAVGMATNIPPHNIGEVIDATIAYIDRPGISIEKLLELCPGPDFPTGGIIVNADELPEIYTSGEGKIRVRARTEIEKGEYGKNNIVITEIPYTVSGNKEKLVGSLVDLMKNKTFDEIADVRDESSKEGIRIVIEVKKDRDAENLLNGLYKKSQMEDTYGVNLLAIRPAEGEGYGQPETFNLKSMIEAFVNFQEELYTREYEFLLDKARKRLEVVEGLIRAVDVIDLIIEILRGSDSVKQAKACLIEGETEGIRFKNEGSEEQAKSLLFSEVQTNAILAMPLQRLIGLEIMKLREENEELQSKIDEYRKILGDKKELFKVMKERLREYKKLYRIPRRTELMNTEAGAYVEKVVIEDLYVLFDRFGYTKCIDAAAFARQTPEFHSEYVRELHINNTDKICIFTDRGNMYQVKMDKIPRCKPKDKGTLIHNLCKMDNDENGILYIGFEELYESMLMFVTESGYIKLVSGAEFETGRQKIAATKLDSETDHVVGIETLTGSEVLAGTKKVILLTDKGLSLGFPVGEVNEFKKSSRGVKAISLAIDDKLVYGTAVDPAADTFVYRGQTLNARRVRNRKRGVRGQNADLAWDGADSDDSQQKLEF